MNNTNGIRKHTFSFEVFPPKQSTSFENIKRVTDSLIKLNPDFISVTYGAGGTAKDNRTVEVCKLIANSGKSKPVAHLTCIGSTKGEIDEILAALIAIGVKDILALRGDRNPNVTQKGDFEHAVDLIYYIKSKMGDKFNILAACYPAGHNESANQKEDILNLKKKVDAGVSALITQMFFDNEEFYRFRDIAEIAGINIPIEAGIMPITNTRQIEKVISLSGASMPTRLTKLIAKYGNNDNAMFDAGTSFATSQIVELLSSDISGIHLYTMNNPSVAENIYGQVKGLLEV